MHNGFSIAACWIVGYRRVFELQALPALHTHPIGTLHPVVVIQRLIGGRRIKRWTVGNILKAWMIERVMVGAQRRGEAMPDMLDQGLLINGHRYRLAHFRVAGQHCVVKVEEQPLEVASGGRRDDRITAQALVRLQIGYIHIRG